MLGADALPVRTIKRPAIPMGWSKTGWGHDRMLIHTLRNQTRLSMRVYFLKNTDIGRAAQAAHEGTRAASIGPFFALGQHHAHALERRMIAAAGDDAAHRFLEFFAATISNRNTPRRLRSRRVPVLRLVRRPSHHNALRP